MGADDALLLRLGEYIHHAAVAFRPVSFGDAVHERDIEVVRSQLTTEAVEIGARLLRGSSPRLGEHGDLVSWNVLQRLGDIRMTAIGIGRVEEPQAAVMSLEEQVGKALHSERGLVRMMAA